MKKQRKLNAGTVKSEMTPTILLEARLATKNCNQCLWQVKGAEWRSRCVFQDMDGHYKTYLQEAPAGQPFGLGCILCAAYADFKGVANKTPFQNYSKGREGKLQLEDVLRHGNQSKRTSYHCGFHQSALHWRLKSSIPPKAQDDSQEDAPVTAVQCLLSLETLWSSLGGQCREYQRRCEAHRRTATSHKVSILDSGLLAQGSCGPLDALSALDKSGCCSLLL